MIMLSLLLVKDFIARPPLSLAEARHRVIELTGMERDISRIEAFLKRHGFVYRKCGYSCRAKLTRKSSNNGWKSPLKVNRKQLGKGKRSCFLWMRRTLSYLTSAV